MSQMLTSEGSGWYLDTEKCPADFDLVSLFETNDVHGKSIFHMGPGAHHYFGRTLAENGSNNSVIAITNCRAEMTAYVDWAEQHAEESLYYKVLFGDIHQTDARQLPRFDYVSLPHLGEMSCPAEYATHGIAGVVSLFSGKMTWMGRFVFYRRSAAWDKVAGIIDQMLRMGWEADEFASLIVMRRVK